MANYNFRQPFWPKGQGVAILRRRALVKWAADSKSNGGFSLLCEMLGYSVDFDDANAVEDAEKYVQTRLKPWRNALYYGKDQEMMHSCTGWFLGRNILQIEREIAGALVQE